MRGGEVFFAFAGEQTDGHLHLADAFARGAGAAVVQAGHPRQEAPAGSPVIEVADTIRALHDLARHARDRGVPRRLVGITGSAGKTTTKELLAALLAARFPVAWTPGNLNNLYGFPLSLLNVPDGTEWMVAEMGMSTPGELRRLSLLGRPDAAVFTVVRPVHLEFFASVRGIAEAKSELLAGLAVDGLVVANADDPEVSRIARRHAESPGFQGRLVRYGIHSAADVRARDIAPESVGSSGAIGSRFVLAAGGGQVAARLPIHGLYNVENCLAAAACAWAVGVPLAEIAAALQGVRSAAMRGVVHRLEGPRGAFTLIDDSYNSNPDALGRALESAALLPGERHLAVLGDMLELGPQGPDFHRESGERAARLGFAPVAGVGELARELVAGAGAAGAEALWLPDAAAAARWAFDAVREGDVVLIKGSRGIKLDTVVRELKERCAVHPAEGRA